MSRQVLKSFSEIAQAVPQATDSFVEDYDALKEDVEAIANSFKPLSGVGSPVGVVISNNSKTYYDTTLSPVSVTAWFSDTIGVDTDWVIVN